MENEDITKIIHDGKSLLTVLNKLNIDIKSFKFDTAIAAYLIDSAKSSYDLTTLINEYLFEEVGGSEEEVKIKIFLNLIRSYEVLEGKIKKKKWKTFIIRLNIH